MIENKRPDGRVISIRLLPQEAEILKAKAKEANMSQARFLKQVIFYGGAYEKTAFKRDDISKLQYELDRIGNNVRQIKTHSHKSTEKEEIELLRLCDNYSELLSAFYDFVHDLKDE